MLPSNLKTIKALFFQLETKDLKSKRLSKTIVEQENGFCFEYEGLPIYELSGRKGLNR